MPVGVFCATSQKRPSRIIFRELVLYAGQRTAKCGQVLTSLAEAHEVGVHTPNIRFDNGREASQQPAQVGTNGFEELLVLAVQTLFEALLDVARSPVECSPALPHDLVFECLALDLFAIRSEPLLRAPVEVEHEGTKSPLDQRQDP